MNKQIVFYTGPDATFDDETRAYYSANAAGIGHDIDREAIRETEQAYDYARELSRLRHAAVEQDGDTWEQACRRFPGTCGMAVGIGGPPCVRDHGHPDDADGCVAMLSDMGKPS